MRPSIPSVAPAPRHRLPWALLALGGVAVAGMLLLGHPGRVLADEVPTVAPTPRDAILDWSFVPSIQVPTLLAAALYLGAVRRVRRRHPDNPVPLARTLSFLAGLAVIEYALQGPVDHYEATLFSDHMIQHLLLMMVAAPLFVMSAPVTLLLRVASPQVRARWILPLLHSRPLRLVSHPIVASIVFSGIMWVAHFSFIYELALENDSVHNAEHLAYLASALLFWWPMIGRDPSPWRVSYPVRLVAMLLQMGVGAFLGVAIMDATAPLYPHYAALQLTWITPLADQQLGGAIMWGAGGLGFLATALLVVYDWMHAEEKAAARMDARLDREERARRTRGAAPVTGAADGGAPSVERARPGG
jgi:putative membrane protein